MSNFIPSTFSRKDPSPSTAPPASIAEVPSHLAQPQSTPYQDCESCRITGTATFTFVGIYSLAQIRSAKTPVGRGAALAAGLGFLTIAAARWTQGERIAAAISRQQ
ncbi:transmembrane protein [Meredithblackwellia eburnea MCA 4105]